MVHVVLVFWLPWGQPLHNKYWIRSIRLSLRLFYLISTSEPSHLFIQSVKKERSLSRSVRGIFHFLNMFLKGKTDAWLTIDHPAFLTWASKNGICLHNAKIDSSPLGGSGVFVSKDSVTNESTALITIPSSMILSKSRINDLAKHNVVLQEFLNSLANFDDEWKTV
jgi:hypothetical protein